MNNIEITILIGVVSLFLNELNTRYIINPYIFIIFINLCGLFNLLNNLHFNVTIRYGN